MLKIIYMLKTLSRAHLPTVFSAILPDLLKTIYQITKLKVVVAEQCSSFWHHDPAVNAPHNQLFGYLSALCTFQCFSSDIQRVTQCIQLSKLCALPSARPPMSVNNNGREFFLSWATEYPLGATQNPLSLKRKIHLSVPLRRPTIRG